MAFKYISFFPKPLLDDLVAGRWLPVVGAGLSLNANVPPGKKMPAWADLSRALGNDLSDFFPNGVLDAISAYEHEFGRPKLIENLSDLLLVHEAQPGETHKEFCSIPFELVCTTNFDFLLERQYELIPRYTHPVVDEDQLAINVSNGAVQLLKLHGDLRHPNRLVITEADYDGFLTTYPLIATYLANQLISKTAVFIGYSLDDPDFRQIQHVVDERLGRSRRMRYAITVNASAADAKRYERRGVHVINLPGPREKYGEILASAFHDLREFMRDNVISVNNVKEEEPLRELRLPRESASRLCFVAAPLKFLSFYKERVFPIVDELGLVPVTADEVVTPGENISAQIDALIDRAAVMIVEVGSSSWTNAEFQMAIARLKREEAVDRPSSQGGRLHLIVVASGADQIPIDARGVNVIVRPDWLSPRIEAFAAELRDQLTRLTADATIAREAEPRRLLAAREYRAAVIAAMTLMEATLRERMRKNLDVPEERRMALRTLIDRAHRQGVIHIDDQQQIDQWVRLRNSAVHTPEPISKAQATELVAFVYRLLNLPYA